MKYRKKPVVIEAIKLESDNVSKVLAFTGGLQIVSAGYDDNDMPFVNISTLEGIMSAKLGDYIIRGVKGELYPCKPDIFEMTYEAVDESV